MAKIVDPARVEQDARARFVESPAVRGERVAGDRYVEIVRRARLIAVSDGLADAVVARLVAKGVSAAVDQVRVDPAVNDEQVMAVTCALGDTSAVLPLRPGATTLRLYPAGNGIVLTAPPLATIELPLDAVENDRWVSAAVIADTVADHLVASP